jgi:MFS family permease
MTQAQASSTGIFYGWWIVLVCMLGISTGTGPFGFASFGLFMEPFEREFGWNRAEQSGCLSVMLWATAFALPIVGRFVDRYGSRTILLSAMVVLALCLAAIPTFVTELWQLALIFLVIGTLGAGTNSIPYMPVLSAWFNRRRGLAIGIAIAGIGFGYFYVPLVVHALTERYGWRAGYYGLSAIIVFGALPLVFFGLRDTPQEMGLKPDGDTSGPPPRASSRDVGLTMPEILRTREFWVIAAMFVLLSFVLNGMLNHVVPMLTDRGMSRGAAAAVASTEGLVVFLSRIFIGYLNDRFFAPRVAMVFFSLSALGLAMFAMGAAHQTAFIGAVLVGLSLGAEVDIVAYLCGRYFGLKSFGAAYGMLFAANLVGTALGPFAFGVGFELTGSYVGILSVCVVLNMLVVGLMALLRPYPNWETAPVTGA